MSKRLEKLKKEYAEQDNRGTAYPFYVAVQEWVCVGVMAEGYSVNCPCGDGKEKTEYIINLPGEHQSFDSMEDAKESVKEQLEDCSEEEIRKSINDIQEITVGYIWYPVEFFLTIKGAEEYIRCNAHNHGKLRTYVKWFERRNYEMRELLEDIGFKTND